MAKYLCLASVTHANILNTRTHVEGCAHCKETGVFSSGYFNLYLGVTWGASLVIIKFWNKLNHLIRIRITSRALWGFFLLIVWICFGILGEALPHVPFPRHLCVLPTEPDLIQLLLIWFRWFCFIFLTKMQAWNQRWKRWEVYVLQVVSGAMLSHKKMLNISHLKASIWVI